MRFLNIPATLLTAFFFFSGLIGRAQDIKVGFKILNTRKEPVAFSTITIVPVTDSINKQNKIADSSGIAAFTLQKNQLYTVRISSINYQELERTVNIKGDQLQYRFTLQTASTNMAGVIVTARKPLMRQEDDKTIVDPENLAAASTNAYEILEKTPGLYVDQDGNIYLNSTTPAIVYINGREQKMSAADIATMLKNLPPNAIASIEIMRTPSAKYDASGTGGIVNVVLKKGVRIGLTGSVTAGMNQGVYGNQFIGLNLNNNNGNTSSYLNLQYSHRNSYEEIRTNRMFSPDSLLSQDAFTKYPANSYYLGYGTAYQIGDKWEFAYDGRLSYNNSSNTGTNQSIISKISTEAIAADNNTLVYNKGVNYSINQGVNLKYKIDSAGSVWTTDISYTYSPNTTDQQFVTQYFLPNYPSLFGDGNLDNKLQFLSGQTNLLKKLNKSITIETGLKSSLVNYSNTTDYYYGSGSSRIKDEVRTGSYKYKENINAAYLQASKNFSGVVLKMGTRMENTNMVGNQLTPRDTSFKIHRTDFFPYVYLSRSLMKIAGYDLKGYLVYRRTITRPAYEYLNPSQRYIDPYLFETGNPSLRPQFTQNYEANISVDERPIFALGENRTKDIFTQVVYTSDSSKRVSSRTYDNLGSNKEIYFRALGAIPPGKRYFFVMGVQYNHNFYQGQYENKPLQFERGSWTIFSYQTFKITPLTQLTLNGFVRFNGQLQFYELSTFGALNMSLSQQLFKKKMVITLSGNDLFYTNNNQFVLQQGSVNATGFRKSDTQRFGINIRYNFGIRKKEENNLFNVDSPEKS